MPNERQPSAQKEPGRIAFIFGAGASKDAGLKLTADLARVVVEVANDHADAPAPAVQALNFVYSQMVGYRGEAGGNPLAAVNIETLVSALRLLATRETHEVAPFVASWKTGALGFLESGVDSGVASKLDDAVRRVVLGGTLGGRTAAPGEVAQLVRALSERSPSLKVFGEAEKLVLRGIHRELSNLATTDYLDPLADLAGEQQGGVDIITMNYDLSIETMAARRRINVDRAIDRWKPGTPLSFNAGDGGINLIKVHGSLDWSLCDDCDGDWLTRPCIHVRGEDQFEAIPSIVVGDREKLATSGPTLALLHAAESALVTSL